MRDISSAYVIKLISFTVNCEPKSCLRILLSSKQKVLGVVFDSVLLFFSYCVMYMCVCACGYLFNVRHSIFKNTYYIL